MFKLNKIVFFALIISGFAGCKSHTEFFSETRDSGTMEFFKLSDIALLNSPFLHAQELDKKYLLDLEPDRLLAPYLKEAGLTPKAENYTNWENTGLDGHIGGHYVSALSLMYASTGDTEIKQRLDYMLAELKRCQDANGNGYLSGVPNGKVIWEEISKGNIRANSFGLNDRWVPLYNIHKIYSGLRDAYMYTGNEEAKTMLIKLTDWAIELVSGLTDEQIQEMLRSEHGGLNEIFADVAAITGDEKYMKLAKQFSHKVVLDPLIKHEDKLTGMHANTQIPKVIGFERIAEIEKDTTWAGAAKFFWEDVVKERSVSIGGNSAYEHFNPKDNFSVMVTGTQGPETCNTYNMLKLTKMLYQDYGEADYMDYYEKALYNHILSTQNPNTGGLVYFTQMRPGHYRVYSQPQTSFWCCVGSGIENHAKYGEMIYAHTNQSLVVNLFIPSKVKWEEKGVELLQENNFPNTPETHFTIQTQKDSDFILKVRNPEWAHGKVTVEVNGEAFTGFDKVGDYIAIRKIWKDGDKVTVHLPMTLHTEQMPDDSHYYSILYGPIVLAAKTSQDHQDGLFADDSRGGHIAQGEIKAVNTMPILVSKPDEIVAKLVKEDSQDLHFILNGLYYSEDNATHSLPLMPFYALQESRYIIYFPQASPDELETIKKQQEEREEAARILNEKTVDVVICGEQQPESDHFIQQKDTRTGYDYERHWREGGGLFSYQMLNETGGAKYVYVNYLDANPNRSCEVYFAGKKIGEITSNGDQGKTFVTAVFEIPEEQRNFKDARVEIRAKDGLWMPKIVEVRMLKDRL